MFAKANPLHLIKLNAHPQVLQCTRKLTFMKIVKRSIRILAFFGLYLRTTSSFPSLINCMALLVTECQELHKKGPFFTRPLLSLTFLSSPNYANKGSISVVKGRIEADRKANEKVAIKGKEEKRTTKVSMAFCRIKGRHQNSVKRKNKLLQ